MTRFRTISRRRAAAAALGAAAALSAAAAAGVAAAACPQGRVPNAEIRVELLTTLADAPDGVMTVIALVDRLKETMKPCGEDLRRTTNGETLFAKKVRSLAYSDDAAIATSLELRGMASYLPGPPARWRITASGREEVRAWRARLTRAAPSRDPGGGEAR